MRLGVGKDLKNPNIPRKAPNIRRGEGTKGKASRRKSETVDVDITKKEKEKHRSERHHSPRQKKNQRNKHLHGERAVRKVSS